MDMLDSLQSWHWLILMFLLLGAETLGIGGFLLGSAAAALLVGVVKWLLPELGWAGQLVVFAVGSLVFSVAYWKFFKKMNDSNDYPNLNNRASQLIGQYFQLDQNVLNGQGKAQVGDTLWAVQTNCKRDLAKGTTVVVVGCQGMTLMIESSDRGA